MTQITLDDIQRDLLGYLRRVRAGETFVVVDADQRVAEIKPVAHDGLELRPYGLCAGEFEVPDDFDAPLPDEIIAPFEGA
jgi:antitoxin (DNA-binding transcriptional repressor) of toxin-antitoxin stability system